jgi:type I restriction enzyme S subunit
MELKPGYKLTEVGVIPEDWEVVPLGGFVKITSGASPSQFRFSGGGIPYFKVEQLGNTEKYLDVTDTPYLFESGDTVSGRSVIFAKRGGL